MYRKTLGMIILLLLFFAAGCGSNQDQISDAENEIAVAQEEDEESENNAAEEKNETDSEKVENDQADNEELSSEDFPFDVPVFEDFQIEAIDIIPSPEGDIHTMGLEIEDVDAEDYNDISAAYIDYFHDHDHEVLSEDVGPNMAFVEVSKDGWNYKLDIVYLGQADKVTVNAFVQEEDD